MRKTVNMRSTPAFSGNRTLILTVQFIILFFPTFWGYLSPGTGQLLYTLGTIILTLPILFKIKAIKHNMPLVIPGLFIIWVMSYLATLAFGAFNTQGHGVVTWRDFTDVVRPLFYFYFFILGYVLNRNNYDVFFFVKVLMVLMTLSLLFDVLKFNTSLQNLMKLYTLFDAGSLNYIRYSGTFCYCYNFGFIILFVYGCLLTFYRRKILTFTFCAILTMLIGSRSIIIAFAVVSIVYFIISPIKRYKKIISLPIMLIVISGICLAAQTWEIPVLSDSYQYAERLYLTLTGTASDGSLSSRNDQWDIALSRFIQSPLLGVGPIKGDVIIEIQLGYYLSSWGILGTGIFLSVMFAFLIAAIKGCRIDDTAIRNFSLANILWIVSSFFVGMSTPIIDQIRVFQLFFIIQGYQLSLVFKSKYKRRIFC